MIRLFSSSSLLAECDSALGHVVWTHFNRDSVAWKNSDEELPHFAADIGQNFVAVLKFDSKHRIGQGFGDFGFEGYLFFFSHFFFRHELP